MTTEAKGKIVLSGFSLEPSEKASVDSLIKNYESKISERFDYKEIKLRMKKSKHGKTFLHEIQGLLIGDKRFEAKVTDYNLFSAISQVFEKLMKEEEHYKRTSRQIRRT